MKTKSILNQSGIYKITNKVTYKFYLGSATNILKRWKFHRNSLKKNRGINGYLQNAYNKYGPDNFTYEVVEFIDTHDLTDIEKKNKILELEQKYLDNLTPWNRQIGYNQSKTADSPLGTKHSLQSRKRMSESHIGNKHTAESKQKISESQYKKVYQLDTNGKVIAVFNSCIEAENKTGFPRQLISMCCRGITKTAKSYYWTYDISQFVKPISNRKTIKRPWKQRRISNYKQSWNSIQDACISLNLTRSQVANRLKSKKLIYV